MSIDWWTVGLQTVNVAILIALLGYFFWRPMAAMIEQRRASVLSALGDAQAKRNEATAALAEIERTRAGIAAERDAILQAAHEEAARALEAARAEAAKQVEALHEAGKAAAASEREAESKAWAERASRLAVNIAERLAARLEGQAVRAAFLDWLLQEIRSLPEPIRQSVADGANLEAVSAAALAPEDQARYLQLIAEAFGGHPQINFTADPALIAGLELRGPQFIVANSWRADLKKILGEIEP